MLQYTILIISLLPILLQIAVANTNISSSEDYQYGFNIGKQDAKIPSLDIGHKCDGRSYGCTEGYFDGFQPFSEQIQAPIGDYDQGYKDGIAVANANNDIV